MTRRRIAIALVILIAVLALVAEGVRRYASGQLTTRLAEIYGGRLEADVATANWRSTTLGNVRLYDADGETVVATIEGLTADLTLWDLVVGRTTPDHLELHHPQLSLRFDESGQLLTQLPQSDVASGELPREITATGATLEIAQTGREPQIVSGIELQVAGSNGQLHIAGTVHDPRFGDWQLGGDVRPATAEGVVSASSDRLVLSPELLADFPLVSPQLLDDVTASGPLRIAASYDVSPVAGDPALRATVEALGVDLRVPSQGIELANTTGTLTLQDSVADIKELRGHTAGGTITASGTANLSAQPPSASLSVQLNDIEVAQAPAALPIPKELSGTVSGQADLRVTLTPQGPVVSGRGNAHVSNPAIAGTPVDPIDIELSDSASDEPVENSARTSSVITLNIRWRNAPIEPLVKQYSNLLPRELDDAHGFLSTDLRAEIPLATASDWTTYGLQGSVAASELAWRDTALGDIKALVNFSDGVLRIDDIAGRIAGTSPDTPGRVAGSITAGVAPLNNAYITVAVQNAPLQTVAVIADLDERFEGSAELTLQATLPLQNLSDVTGWKANGQISVPYTTLRKREIQDISADFEVASGSLHIPRLRANLARAKLTAAAEAQLSSPYSYTADFQLPTADIADLLQLAEVRLPTVVTGQLKTTGQAAGTLAPLTWLATGHLATTPLQISTLRVPESEFDWSINSQAARVTNLVSRLYGGTIRAEATLPLEENSVPHVTGQFDAVQLNVLATQFTDAAAELTGSVSGSFDVSGLDPASLAGSLRVESSSVESAGIELTDLSATAKLAEGTVSYAVAATLLDGNVTAEGQIALGQNPATDAQGLGRVEFTQLQLAQAARIVDPRNQFQLAGAVGLQFSFSHAAPLHQPTGHGRLSLQDVRFGGRDLSPQIAGDVVLSEQELRLPDIFAQFAGGSLRASLDMDLAQFGHGEYSIAVDRVSSAQLLASWPEIAEQIEGPIDVRLRGTLGRRISGSGTVAMAQGRVAGVDLTGIRLPVQFAYARDNGYGELQIAESTVQAARGRIVGQADITFGRELTLSARTRLVGLEIRSLTGSVANLGAIGSGRVSGRATLTAQNLRSIDDLNASFNLTFAQTQALQFPVLRNLSRYVAPTVPTTTSFDRGDVRGRLARGVVRVDEFALTGSDARILASGTATLQGRLNLNVTAQRGGQPLAESFIQRIAIPIIQAQTVPISLLTQANSVLSDRIIYLRVSGTVRSPSIQLRPAPQLQAEAVRFFLGEVTDRLPIPTQP